MSRMAATRKKHLKLKAKRRTKEKTKREKDEDVSSDELEWESKASEFYRAMGRMRRSIVDAQKTCSEIESSLEIRTRMQELEIPLEDDSQIEKIVSMPDNDWMLEPTDEPDLGAFEYTGRGFTIRRGRQQQRRMRFPKVSNYEEVLEMVKNIERREKIGRPVALKTR